MDKKTVFINLDYMPPSPAMIKKLPDLLDEADVISVAFRLIDNFPWAFDGRMQSDSAFPEQMVEYLDSGLSARNIEYSMMFPGPGDFTRILRVKGFRRMALDDKNRPLFINCEQIGFKSFIDNIMEDMAGLLQNAASFALRETDDSVFKESVMQCAEDCGCALEFIPFSAEFITADRLIGKGEAGSMASAAMERLIEAENAAVQAVYRLKQYSSMSASSVMPPAAFGTGLCELLKDAEKARAELDQGIDDFLHACTPAVDEAWLDLYIRSVRLTADGEFSSAVSRLRQIGVLN